MPCDVSLPAFLPVRFQQQIGKTTAWRIKDTPADLLKASLQSGFPLKVAQLDGLKDVLGFNYPAKGTGSGKNGNIVRIDKAKALLDHLFGDAWTPEMLAGVGGRRTEQQTEVKLPVGLVEALGELERDEQRDFDHLHGMIKEKKRQMDSEKEAQKNEPGQRASSDFADAYEVRTYTPVSLKDLLPLKGENGVYCNRNPEVRRYQACYPGQGLSWPLLLLSRQPRFRKARP